jgi:REP element-mobilizing transposase RayT
MPGIRRYAYLHFVWATHGRLPLIAPEIERDLHRFIRRVCMTDGCEVLAVNGMPDHVHLMVNLSNMVTMADLMQHVNGGSSRFVSGSLQPGQTFIWRPGYSVDAVSRSDRATVVSYIDNQKQRHATGNIWPGAEPSDDEYAFGDDVSARGDDQ